MSFAQCLEDALKEKKFGPKKRDEIMERFEGLKEEYIADGHSEANAERMAASEAVARHEIEIKERKKRKLAHIKKTLEVNDRLAQYGNKGKLWKAAEAFIEMDDKAPWLDYVSMNDRIRGQAHAMLAGLLKKYGNSGAGIMRTTAGLDNVLRELFSPNSSGDNAAAGFAKAWDETVDLLVRRFNAAGGTLMRRQDWRLPQHQSRFALAKAGKRQWVNDHLDMLDWDKMRDMHGRRIPANKRVEVLERVFDTLKTNGHIKYKKTTYAGRSIGNKLEQSRFLVYKDAESWLRMHKAYGDGNIFDTMMNHIDTMSHQIAMIETFGPNPGLMKDVIKDKVLRALAKEDVADASGEKLRTATAENKLRKFDDMFSVISRETAMPESSRFGMIMAGVRNIMTSAYLGSAAVTAIPGDLMTSMLTSMFNRTPVFKSLGQYMKMMNPLSDADRQLAIRSGLIAETATSMAYGMQRMTGIEMYGPSIARRISDVVMRLSLLSPHTQAARWAFQMEVMGGMAEHAGKNFEELPFVDMMVRNGITSEDWDILRSIDAYEHKGAKFLRPDDLYNSDFDVKQIEPIADKFMVMIMKEGKFAVPDASIKGLTLIRGATKPGTFAGEILNSAAMFKNFPVTILMTHGIRGLQQRGLKGKISYLASYLIGMTAVGALSLQMHSFLNGKTARDMTTPEFMGDAVLRGGGLGIWGDFIFSDLNRFGGGKAETIAGPIAQLLTDVTNLTAGNLVEVIQGKDSKLAAEIVRMAKRNTPGSNIWWSRLLLERELWDQLQELADPKAHSKWRRQRTNTRKSYGHDYWWKPGESVFDR